MLNNSQLQQVAKTGGLANYLDATDNIDIGTYSDRYNKALQQYMLQDEAQPDSDSMKHWRLQGGDSTEVWHDIKPYYNLDTGEGLDVTKSLNSSRRKVYKVYAELNNVSIEQAILDVDRQSEAYKISKEAGYDLGALIAGYRKDGSIDELPATAFDIYSQGQQQLEWAKKDQLEHPGTGYKDSWKYLTGDKGVFGRYLSDNAEYRQRAIAAGQMNPNSADQKQYLVQKKLQDKARRLGLGSYSTKTGAEIMDAVNKVSYAEQQSKAKQENRFLDDIDVLQSSTATMLASQGKQLVDVIITPKSWKEDKDSITRSIYLWLDKNSDSAANDEKYGVDARRMYEIEKGAADVAHKYKDNNIGSFFASSLDALKNLDYYIARSAPQTAEFLVAPVAATGLYTLQTTGEQYDKYVKKYGKEPSGTWLAKATAMNMANAGMEMASAGLLKAAIKGNVTRKVVEDYFLEGLQEVSENKTEKALLDKEKTTFGKQYSKFDSEDASTFGTAAMTGAGMARGMGAYGRVKESIPELKIPRREVKAEAPEKGTASTPKTKTSYNEHLVTLKAAMSDGSTSLDSKIQQLTDTHAKLQEMVAKDGVTKEATALQLEINKAKEILLSQMKVAENDKEKTLNSTKADEVSNANKRLLEELNPKLDSTFNTHEDVQLVDDVMTELSTNYSIDTVQQYNNLVKDMIDTEGATNTSEALAEVVNHYKNRLVEDGVAEAKNIIVPVNLDKYKEADVADFADQLEETDTELVNKVEDKDSAVKELAKLKTKSNNNLLTKAEVQKSDVLTKEAKKELIDKLSNGKNVTPILDKAIQRLDNTKVDKVKLDDETILATTVTDGKVSVVPHIKELKDSHKDTLGWVKLSKDGYITEVQSDLYQKGVKVDYRDMGEEDTARLSDDEKATAERAKLKGTKSESAAVKEYKKDWVSKLLESVKGKGKVRIPIEGTINNLQTGTAKIKAIQKRYNEEIPSAMTKLYGEGKVVEINEGKYAGKWLEFNTNTKPEVKHKPLKVNSTAEFGLKSLLTKNNIDKVLHTKPEYAKYALDIHKSVQLHTTKAMDAVVSTHEDTINKMSKLLNKVTLNGKLKDVTLYNLIEDPFTFLTTEVYSKGTSNAKDKEKKAYYEFVGSTAKYNKEVVAAITKVANDFIMEYRQKLTSLSPEDIETYYPEYQGDKAKISKIGVPQKLAVNAIGKKVLAELKVKTDKNMPEEQVQSLQASAGYKVVQLLQGLDILKLDKVDNALDTKLVKELYGDSANTNVKVYNIQLTDSYRNGSKRDTEKELTKIANTYDASNQSNSGELRKPLLSKPSTVRSAKVKNSVFGAKVSEQGLKMLNTLQQTEYKLDLDVAKYISSLLKKNKINVLKAMGAATSSEINSMVYEDAEGAKAKNKVLLDELNNALIEANRIKDSSVWFNWFETRNGRYILDSLTLNPQTNKQIDRWLTIPKKAITKVDPSVGNDMFKFGITQAFGYATDKNTFVSAVKLGEEILNKDVDKLANDLLAGKHVEVDGVELEIEHFGQMVNGVVNAKRWQKGKEFDSTLLFEVDGITNGIILKLLQFPIKAAKEWLYKGGVDLDAKGEGYNDYKNKDNVYDAYQTLVANTSFPTVKDSLSKTVLKVLPKLKDEDKVTSAGRNLAKPILMLFGYGAGTNGIVEESTNSLLKSILNDVVKNKNSLTNEQKRFIHGINKSTVQMPNSKEFADKLIKALQTKAISDITYTDITGVRNMYGTTKLFTYTHTILSNNVIKPMVDSLEDTFSELTEATGLLNELANLQFEVYNSTLNTLLDKAAVIKGSSLTSNEKKRVAKKLEKMQPLVQSFGRKIESIGSGVSQLAGKANAQVKTNKDIYGKNTHNVGLFKEVHKSPGASMGVFPIHFIDATIMANTVNSIGGGITEVHDAMVVGVGNVESAVTEYNKNTHNTAVSNDILYNAAKGLIDTVNNGAILTDELNNKISKILKQYEDVHSRVVDSRNKLFSNPISYSQIPLNRDAVYTSEASLVKNAKLPAISNKPVDISDSLEYVKMSSDTEFTQFYNSNYDIIKKLVGSENNKSRYEKLIKVLRNGNVQKVKEYINKVYDIMLYTTC